MIYPCELKIIVLVKIIVLFLAAASFFFFWFGGIGVGLCVLLYLLSEDQNWKQHGFVFALVIGVATFFAKIFTSIVVWIGLGLLITYIAVEIVLSLYRSKTHVKRAMINEKINSKVSIILKHPEKERIIRVLFILIPILFWSFIFLPFATFAETAPNYNGNRWTEYLDRGLIAMHTESDNIYLSWRFLETDPTDVEFNVYRAPVFSTMMAKVCGVLD